MAVNLIPWRAAQPARRAVILDSSVVIAGERDGCGRSSPGRLCDFTWWPHQDILTSREMQERPRGRRNPQRLRHGVAHNFRFGALQRPRRMMNLAANDFGLRIRGVKGIAFGQEMLQRPWPRGKGVANRAIPALQQSCRRSAMNPPALVMNPALVLGAAHSRAKIRQVKPRARDGYSQRVSRVQAEEPHARLSAACHVSADIQFWKC